MTAVLLCSWLLLFVACPFCQLHVCCVCSCRACLFLCVWWDVIRLRLVHSLLHFLFEICVEQCNMLSLSCCSCMFSSRPVLNADALGRTLARFGGSHWLEVQNEVRLLVCLACAVSF